MRLCTITSWLIVLIRIQRDLPLRRSECRQSRLIARYIQCRPLILAQCSHLPLDSCQRIGDIRIIRSDFLRQGIDHRLHGGHGFRAGLRLGFRFRVSARRFHGGRAVHRPQLVRQRRRGQERQTQHQRHEHTQYSFFHIFPP